MTHEMLNQKVISALCREYESVWLVDSKTLEMSVFGADMVTSIPDSIYTAKKIQNYAAARTWYINNYVVEHDRARVLLQIQPENIRTQLEKKSFYTIEYSRDNMGVVNYNQLVYARVNSDEGELEYIILGFRDIDIRKKAERDDLTGVLTRQVFFEKAENLLKENPQIQYDLMISDIVDFKKINETYGADVGDEILHWVGAQLCEFMSDDVLVGRYGSDQFVVMCGHDFMTELFSEENIERIEQQEHTNGLPHIIIKYGVYECITHDKSILSTCDKAHIALNSIKHHYGKKLATYNDVLRKELETNRKIESNMYKALDEEQFKVYYQPKHDARSGKIIGAEALVRWIHPEYGFMSPADFIPLFEKNGFVVEVDNFVWKKTCENLKKWTDAGIQTVPVSVNASKLTFEQEDLLKKYQKPVMENGISPQKLHLEITETLMTGDTESLIRKLTAIRAMGFQIELDDFGSGYSSINILSTLPLDVVKLDMSFMRKFGDEKRAKVLAACISLAKDLGYKTVSEGVEYKEQCDTLEFLGVDAIQGYYFSKPLPEEDFEKYLVENI